MDSGGSPSSIDFKLTLGYYYKGDLKGFTVSRDEEVQKQQIADFTAGKQRIWFIPRDWRQSSAKDYITETYGEDSLILQREFFRVSVFLFDLSPP